MPGMQGAAGTSRPGRESGRSRQKAAQHTAWGRKGAWSQRSGELGHWVRLKPWEWERAHRSLRCDEEEDEG